MSSTPSEEQTSVVDTCRAKIAKALETEDVKVLGTLYINCMYLSLVSICVLFVNNPIIIYGVCALTEFC